MNVSQSNSYHLDIMSAINLASINLTNSSSKASLITVGFSLELAHYLVRFLELNYIVIIFRRTLEILK